MKSVLVDRLVNDGPSDESDDDLKPSPAAVVEAIVSVPLSWQPPIAPPLRFHPNKKARGGEIVERSSFQLGMMQSGYVVSDRTICSSGSLSWVLEFKVIESGCSVVVGATQLRKFHDFLSHPSCDDMAVANSRSLARECGAKHVNLSSRVGTKVRVALEWDEPSTVLTISAVDKQGSEQLLHEKIAQLDAT